MIVVPVVLISLFVVALLSFHVYLMMIGRTTKETLSKSEAEAKKIEFSGIMEESLRTSLFVGVNKEEEREQEKKPYLCFALPLLKEEVDYLNEFDFCATGDLKIVEM